MSFSVSQTNMGYQRLSSEEKPGSLAPSDDPLDDSTEGLVTAGPVWRFSSRKKFSTAYLLMTALNCVTFISTTTMFGTWFYQHHLVLNPELRRASTYSPLFDYIDLDLHTVTLNGTLFPSQHPSLARQIPSPAVDALWNAWELVRFIPITKAQVIAMGKDPSTVAKFEDADWGLGDDAYAGDLDVFHQLHCLNALRKFAYADYYNKTPIVVRTDPTAKPTYQEIHVNHCVDMLMQALTCSGNVNFITSNWVATQPWPYPDMSVQRKCIDFDKLTAWRNANAVDPEDYDRIMTVKPPGVQQRPAPDALYDFYGLENPNHIRGANAGNDFNF